MTRIDLHLRSVGIATDADVLPQDAIIERHGELVVVRTPTNPTHFWGNFLVFDHPPAVGDRARWEAAFAEHVSSRQVTSHVAFAWDVVDGELGAAREELGAAGYELEAGVTLIARPEELRDHPRASREVTIRALDPTPGGEDEALWVAANELQVRNRDAGHSEATYRTFVAARTADRRRRFVAGDGAWYVAVTGSGEVVAGCGVVVTAGRGRYQAVDTAPTHRRQGIASRLVVAAGRDAVERFGARQLVIVAEAGYHALPLYESLGFVARERTVGACWWPGGPTAASHPELGDRARPA